jgi:hypothetical protein
MTTVSYIQMIKKLPEMGGNYKKITIFFYSNVLGLYRPNVLCVTNANSVIHTKESIQGRNITYVK